MKKTSIIFAAAIIIVLGAGFSAYYVLVLNKQTKTQTTNESNDNKTKKPSITCGVLKADKDIVSGTAPFAPVLRGKLTGPYDQNNKICECSIDKAISGSSFVKNGECVFGGHGLMTKGEHEISYQLSTDKYCGEKIKVTVK